MSSIGVTTPSPPTAALHCAAAAGAAYNTATAFEKVTTKKLSRKVLASCRIIPQGRELTVLMNYYKKELTPFRLKVPPLALMRVVGDWARDQLEAVGVKVGPQSHRLCAA